MNSRYAAVASRAQHRCEYCSAPEVVFNFAFEVEHIEARSRGGANDAENTALACRACNLYKADHEHAADPQSGSECNLFHPRRDRWADHFRVEEEARIEGRTAVGRATVELLRFNSQPQVLARRIWIALGLYPP